MPDPIRDYLAAIQHELAVGKTTEHTHRPALKVLIEALGTGVTATNEPGRVECGAPDFVVSRPTGVSPIDFLTLGYVETKDIGKPLDDEERSEQLQRYRRYLDNLLLTDYLEFRWYVGGDRRQVARLADIGPGGKVARGKDAARAVADLLQAFLGHTPAPIDTPKDLAERMACLTHMVRDTIVEAFRRDQASPLLRDVRRAFATRLIPDLDQPEKTAEFADMYAQTIAYGLFAARCGHQGPGPFSRLAAAAEIPRTNPFLRKLFETITGVDLDEEPYAGLVDDLAQLLAHTDMGQILRHMRNRNQHEDPIVHFYETFLATYDPDLREMRGVYYTPEPIVSYIVHSVDSLLRDEFGLPDGLANAEEITYEREGNGKRAHKVTAKAPRVLVLDPACGTATFLYSVVDLVRERFRERGSAGMWSAYVREQLLPRLFGFELLMAPYAVAHLKLAMQLAAQDLAPAERTAWAYDFSGDERLGIYLTNTLEEAERWVETLWGPLRIVTEEANAAAWVKRDLPVLVVLGNPPYSGHSANRSWEVKDGRRVPTFIGELMQSYYHVDGHRLRERNPKWLQDDYVKFIRWAQWRLERTGAGILALVTNHGYLDNPTFRGMRQQLLQTFSSIYILDLHGNVKKRERPPDGGKDENVFDIQQGVSIGIFVRQEGKQGYGTVRRADLWGPRDHKYQWLLQHDVATTPWTALQPESPYYLFTVVDAALHSEYQKYRKVTDILPVNVLGFQTHRDSFAVDFDRSVLRQRIKEMRNDAIPDGVLRDRYELQDNRDWELAAARAQLKEDPAWERALITCLYRPFDWRACYFSQVAMDYPRRELRLHVAGRDNLCLGVGRQGAAVNDPEWSLTLVSREPIDANVFRRGGITVFPLYLYPDDKTNVTRELFDTAPWPPGPDGRRPNINPDVVSMIEDALGLQFVPDGAGDLELTFGPEDILHYVYGMLHCPSYRSRYADFLKTDFPRVPFLAHRDLFRSICSLGARLVRCHLLTGPHVTSQVHFPLKGSNRVEARYPRYVEKPSHNAVPGDGGGMGQVHINDIQYFDDVPREVWEYTLGGYQVCERWLKERRGRDLSYSDLAHYQKVVAAISETLRLMEEIDEVIPAWPLV